MEHNNVRSGKAVKDLGCLVVSGWADHNIVGSGEAMTDLGRLVVSGKATKDLGRVRPTKDLGHRIKHLLPSLNVLSRNK